jgi:hypothetical protein
MQMGYQAQVGEIGKAHRNLIYKFKGEISFGNARCISKTDRKKAQL